MYKSLKYSLALHVILIAALFFKLPTLYKNLDSEMVVVVDIVKPASITNLKNTSKSNSKKKVALKKKTTKPKKQKVVKQVASSHVKKIPDAPKKIVPKLDEFESLLKDLENSGGVSKKNVKMDSSSNSSTKTYNDTIPLSISEKDNIKTQIEKKFVNPVALDFKPQELIIKIKLIMNKDGSIEAAQSSDSKYPQKYSSIFNTLQSSLIRAAHIASPLRDLPQEKYEGRNGWRQIELTFDAYYLMHSH